MEVMQCAHSSVWCPGVMQYEEVPTPTPGPGQVLVRLAAAGLNYIDVYQRTGMYPNKLPYTMGLEGSGMVAGSARRSPGSKRGIPSPILVSLEPTLNTPWSRQSVWCVCQPVDVKVGAAAMLQGMTAHYLAYTTYPLKAGTPA